MGVCVLTLFALLYFFSAVVDARPTSEGVDVEDEGYYWRDYSGSIPKDALPGGTNSYGKTTYIGQVLYGKQLVPAKIDPEQKKVYYESGYQEYIATQNIKILCTKHPEQFEWIHTGNGIIQNIPSETLLIGGYEEGATLYIGRKQLEDELVVGKVISTKIQTTLNTTKNGKGIQHAQFEVLTYNPEIKATKTRNDNTEGDITAAVVQEGPESGCITKSITLNIFNIKNEDQ